MSENKAIDKAYLQRQLVNFNRDVVNKKYISKLNTIPTPAISVSGTPTYYSEDQVSLYNNNIIQWVGSDTSWGSGANAITLRTGFFYKLEVGILDGASGATLNKITAQNTQAPFKIEDGVGVIVDDTDPEDVIINANIGTLDTVEYNSTDYDLNSDTVVTEQTSGSGDTYVAVQNKSRVKSPILLDALAIQSSPSSPGSNSYTTPAQRLAATYRGSLSFAVGDIIQYIGADEVAGAPDPEYDPTLDVSPELFKKGCFYQLMPLDGTDHDVNYWQHVSTQIESTYAIEAEPVADTGFLKTYTLKKTDSFGAITSCGSINIPKDFLVKSGSVVTYTANGGFWFKNKFYEKNSNQSSAPYSWTASWVDQTTGSTVTETLYTTIDLTSYSGGWPVEIYSSYTSAQDNVVAGSVYQSEVIAGWVPYGGQTLVVGQKYIDFVINTNDTTSGSATDAHMYLNISELFDVYTGGDGIDVSPENIISVNIADIDAHFQYTSMPALNSTTFAAIQYIGTDGVTSNLAYPETLQQGGFYQRQAVTIPAQGGGEPTSETRWVLINTAKETEDIDFASNIGDFS